MVARLGSPSPFVPATQTQVTVVPSTAAAANRNVTNGPGRLHSVLVDNQKAAASNTKIWIKIYDVTSQGWTPGTTLPIIIFPVAAWTAADDSQEKGTYQVMVIPEGMPFENGLSISATEVDGDAVGSDPGTDVAVELVHS